MPTAHRCTSSEPLLDEAATSALAPHQAGAGADIFYSYKTNPVPAVLRRLHDRGIGAEVISPFELWLAIELGLPGDRIIYNGPAKSADSIRQAIDHDVHLVNANSAPMPPSSHGWPPSSGTS